MRLAPWLPLALVLTACAAPIQEASTSGASETDTATAGTDSDDSPTGDGDHDLACVPGKVESCPCIGGGQGVQVCDQDGEGFGACDCPHSGTGSGAAETSTSGEPPAGTTDIDDGTTSTSSGGDTSTGETTTDLTTTGGVPGCEDPDDAPALEVDALEVAEQGCDDDPKQFTGMLAGVGDVDWFVYHGDGSQGCFGEPEALLELDAGDDLRLCVFVDCDAGTPDFECNDGAQMNVSPDGLPGCCNDAGISFTLNCMGSQQESARLYVRLDMAAAETCIDYTVDYSFEGGI